MFSLRSFSFLSTVKPIVSPLTQVGNQQLGVRFLHEYSPIHRIVRKQHKGRVPVRIGGSQKGSTIEFAEYGLRLKSEGVRLAAIQLKAADESIMRALRPVKGKLIRRVHTNVAVCTKGNETRMGKGKGPFDYWAVRVPTGKIIFEISANVDAHIASEALRKAAQKLPGVYEVIKKSDTPMYGLRLKQEIAKDVNYLEQRRLNPTPKELNVIKSKLTQFKTFRGR